MQTISAHAHAPAQAAQDDRFPHSPEAEQGILGCIILSPDGLGEAEQTITAGSFYDIRHQTVWRAMVQLKKAGKLIDLITLQQHLKDKKQLTEAGGLPYLALLPDAVLSAAGLDCYVGMVAEKQRLREVAQRAEEIANEARKPDADLAAIEERLRIAQDQFTAGAHGWKDLLEQRAFNAGIELPPPEAVYHLGATIISTPGNLTTITALAKAGKTAAMGGMMASTMAGEGPEKRDCLQFRSANPNRLALLHFDCEQSPFDHAACVWRVVKRAGLKRPPDWFYSYWLTGLDPGQCWQFMARALELNAAKHRGVHSVFLDGAADFVNDVNDAAECNRRVADWQGLAIKHNCNFVPAIHFNPGTDKGRGHLGSQLERKAETNLRLDKADGVTQIWSDKQRGAPIPKGNGVCFQWNDEAGMHLTIENFEPPKIKEKRETLEMQAEDIFRQRPAMRYGEIVSYLTSKDGLRLTESTAARRIRDMKRLEIIEKSVAGLWTRKA
jgi:hypothetical protein